MRYTLWSHGRLIGYTDLDIHTVSLNLRQGFVEPTEAGQQLLEDATGVPRAMVIARKAQRARGGTRTKEDHDVFVEACNRREALNLELRDDNGEIFECDFMRVYDLQDDSSDELAALDEVDDPTEAESCDSTSDDGLGSTAEEIEAMVQQWLEDKSEEEMFHSAWPPPPPPDPRWDTMRYLLQVFLEKADDIDDLLASPDFDDF